MASKRILKELKDLQRDPPTSYRAGCGHELCVRYAIYLCCSFNNIHSEPLTPPGSIPCPLCRHGIVYLTKSRGNGTKSHLRPVINISVKKAVKYCISLQDLSITVSLALC